MRYAMAAWSWSGVIWATVVVCAWLGHITPLEGLTAAEGNRVMFTFGDPNYAATYWTVTIFVVYSTRTPSARWMRVIGYVLLAWALVLTESNGGVLAVGAAIFFLLLLRSYEERGLVGSLATALVIVLAVGGLLTAFPIRQGQAGCAQQRPTAAGQLHRPQRTEHVRAAVSWTRN